MLDEIAIMKDAWSYPVTHMLLFGEPKYFIGVNAANIGSNVPISSIDTRLAKAHAIGGNALTRVELIDRIGERDEYARVIKIVGCVAVGRK